jgi:regulator of cell morphogenesis and NO signaling
MGLQTRDASPGNTAGANDISALAQGAITMNKPGEVTAANIETQTIGDLVAADIRVAGVFDRYGIDFCCGGNVAVGITCREKGIDLEELARELEKATQTPVDRSQNYGAWELPFLADYIVNTHHSYLKENTATIAAYAQKIAQVHGASHPEVIRISEIFDKVAADMTVHLKEEEEQLFPAIRKIVALRKEGSAGEAGDIEALKAILLNLGHEHEEIGAATHAIRALAKDYAIPEGVCNTYRVTYQKLEEFEDDLHKHVHLENNILFPKAAKL